MIAKGLHLVTGATSGIGLRLVGDLLDQGAQHVYVGARNPEGADELRALAGPDRLTILELDLSKLASVRAFAGEVKTVLGGHKLNSIVCNAGLQIPGHSLSEDGFELTFATNHLGHFLLVHELVAQLAPDAVITTTGSGTHNEEEWLPRVFGMRGAWFPSAEQVAYGHIGEAGDSKMVQGFDRYATSKLCNMLFVREMTARYPEYNFFCFDPGLMPDTRLVREVPAPLAWLSRFVFGTLLSPFMKDVSSSQRSADKLAEIVDKPEQFAPLGPYIYFTGEQARRSPRAESDELAEDLYSVSARLTGVTPA